jgi:chemotaxis protein MotB
MMQRAVVILGVMVVGLILFLTSLTTKESQPLSQVTSALAQEVNREEGIPPQDTSRVLKADAAAEVQRLQHANQQLEEYIQYLLGGQKQAEVEAEEGQQALAAARTSEQQAQQTLTGLEQQLRDTQERHQTATDTLKTAQDQLRQCTTAAQTAKADAAEREQQSRAAQAQEVQSLQATMATAQEEHQSVQRALGLAQQKLEECTLQARAALEEAAQQHQQVLEANQRERQTLQATLTTAEQNLERTQQEVQAVHQQRVELQERYQGVTANLDTTQQHLRALMAQVEEENALRQAEQDQEAQLSARLEGVYDQFVEQLRDEIQSDALMVEQNGDHVLVRMAGGAVFTQGMASVRPQGRMMLRKISRILQNHPDYEIHVEGHSDNLPLNAKLRERWGTNWGLSAARAASVIHCLQLLGVPPDHLLAKGYGTIRPLVNHDTPAGRRQNRRVDIIVQPVKPS